MDLNTFRSTRLRPYQGARLRAVTLDGYDRKWASHVERTLGRMELSDIDPEALDLWRASIPTRGARDAAWAVVRGCIRQAVRWGDLDLDPTRRVGCGRAPVRLKAPVLDAAGIRDLLRSLWGHELEGWVCLMAGCGLRPEEASAAEWRAVDWRSGRYHVGSVVHWVSGVEHVERPKTELSERDVWIPRPLLLRLRQVRRPAGRILGGLTHQQASARLKRHCARCGLRWVPPKDLRHSWATVAVASGVDISVVSRYLGHSDISTTARYYLHHEDAVLREASRTVGLALLE